MLNIYELNFSWRLALIFSLQHIGAIIIALLVPLALWLKCLVLLLCCGSAVIVWRRYRSQPAIVRFRQDDGGDWWIVDWQGQVKTAKLLGNSICSCYFVLLNFKEKGKKRRISAMIMSDAMAPDAFRRLRVHLQHKNPCNNSSANGKRAQYKL